MLLSALRRLWAKLLLGFNEDIRDLKSYLLEDKSILETYKRLVMEKMKNVDEKTTAQLASKFNQILKTILKIGAGISKSKEFEDILEDLVEKVAETCLHMDQANVNLFFKQVTKRFPSLLDTMNLSRHKVRLTKSWERFLIGIRLCVLRMLQVMQRGNERSQLTMPRPFKETLKESK